MARTKRPQNSLAKQLGENLRARRMKLGLSQKDVAEASALDGGALSRIENGLGGERGIGLTKLARIAKAVRCEVSDLLKS